MHLQIKFNVADIQLFEHFPNAHARSLIVTVDSSIDGMETSAHYQMDNDSMNYRNLKRNGTQIPQAGISQCFIECMNAIV